MKPERRIDDVVCVAGSTERRPFQSTLTGSEFEWTIVSPDEALDAVARHDPDCVIVGTDEVEVARETLAGVTARHPSMPVVIAPPRGSERLAMLAVREGATDYVPLESDHDDLLDRLDVIGGNEAVPERSSRFDSDDDYLRLLANTLPDEAFVIDETGRYLESRVRPDSGDLYTLAPDELEGRTLHDAFPDDVADDLLSCVRTTLDSDEIQSIEYEAETTDGLRRFEGRVHPIDGRVNGRRAVVWLARDITERARRERELRQRRDQLETVDRINAVVRQVIHTLVEAPTRSDIEREVCHQLVESDLYCGAWIGERTGEAEFSARTGAGNASDHLDLIADGVSRFDCEVMNSIRTGESWTTDRLTETEGIPEPLLETAREENVRSAIAVPISHNETIYGALLVLAGRDDAFSDRERSAFGLLGETIGFTISAVKNRRLLFADAVVELELRIDEGDSFAFDVSESHDCTVSLEWAGTTSRGLVHQYVTVEGLDGETALELAEDHESIESCRLIHDGTDSCTLEFRLTESGVRTLANHGATLQKVSVEDGVADVLVEVPRDVDVRRLLETFRSIYDETQLIARREVDREVNTATERRERIVDRLTDRQLTALRLAYYGGYFDWPRGSTGEDVAEAMGISPPTMHQHLRAALRAVLTEFFESHA